MTPFPSLRARVPAFALTFSVLWLVGGPARTIAVFGALLLVADALIPASPSARALDAQAHFDRLVRARRLRRGAPLEVLDISTRRRRELGLQTIDLDTIAGTVEPGKARKFDRELRPTRASAERWQRLWLAYRLGEPVPPVSVYRVDGRHWLYDGHHRVSVLRHQGAATVDAHVTEWR